MYYAMWGAVHDCHWKAIPDEAKRALESRMP